MKHDNLVDGLKQSTEEIIQQIQTNFEEIKESL